MSVGKRLLVALLMVLAIPVVVVWWLAMAAQVVAGTFIPYRDGWAFGFRNRKATP